MNFYQHHIGDFIRDTSRLSDSQSMAYLRMLWMYYETEEPLQCDADAIAFKIGANASDVHQILKHFFFEDGGFWHNSRCDKEILAYRGKSDKAKKSASARWENAKAMRTHDERIADAKVLDANQEPITNNQSKDKEKNKKKKILKPNDVEQIVWDGWLAHRKERKAAVTELVIEQHRVEAGKAGLSLEQALAYAVSANWSAFKSEWRANKERSHSGIQRSMSVRESANNAMADAMFGSDDVVDATFIEGSES